MSKCSKCSRSGPRGIEEAENKQKKAPPDLFFTAMLLFSLFQTDNASKFTADFIFQGFFYIILTSILIHSTYMYSQSIVTACRWMNINWLVYRQHQGHELDASRQQEGGDDEGCNICPNCLKPYYVLLHSGSSAIV